MLAEVRARFCPTVLPIAPNRSHSRPQLQKWAFGQLSLRRLGRLFLVVRQHIKSNGRGQPCLRHPPFVDFARQGIDADLFLVCNIFKGLPKLRLKRD